MIKKSVGGQPALLALCYLCGNQNKLHLLHCLFPLALKNPHWESGQLSFIFYVTEKPHVSQEI